MIYLLVILLSVVSAVIGRAGGLDKQTEHWIPLWMRQRWIRIWGCPACALLPLIWIHPSWWFVAVYGMLAAAVSTYWDELFGYDNFWFSGFMCGVAAAPLAFCGFGWAMIAARSFFLAVFWGAWCAIFSNDFVEEYGRYGVLPLTSLILLI